MSGALFLDQGFSDISSLGVRCFFLGGVDEAASSSVAVEERPIHQGSFFRCSVSNCGA